ncbi:restless-like transposase [Purpureocillium lavendulum]|uniref:Mitochondrial division protein 1 n=1 Tax=Purpureocillium lavendulum TaxID=1247861 RepID=A0AB34FFU7_9HYPO|nr:restless-like transposase [Purpureocillium lavendulum]
MLMPLTTEPCHTESSSEQNEGDKSKSTESEALIGQHMAFDKALECLHQLASSIRRASVPNSRFDLSARLSTRREVSPLFENFARLLVKYRFPAASESLREQLGAAMSRRRDWLLYNYRHSQKLSQDYDRSPIANAGQPTSTQHAPRPSQTEEPALPLSSSQKEHYRSAILRTQTPLPAYSDTAGSRLSPLNTQKLTPQYWRKHYDDDTQPFVCLFEECDDPPRFFSRLDAWEKHMVQEHSKDWAQIVHSKVWYCDIGDCRSDEKMFYSRGEFEEHLHSKPERNYSATQISALMVRKQRAALRDPMKCPLCETKVDMESVQTPSLAVHVGAHLHYLAGLCVPQVDAAADEDSPGSWSAGKKTEGDSHTDSKAEFLTDTEREKPRFQDEDRATEADEIAAKTEYMSPEWAGTSTVSRLYFMIQDYDPLQDTVLRHIAKQGRDDHDTEFSALGAQFDSHAEEHGRRCLPNTRVELLQEISTWAIDPSSETIFWLNGMAGTGKSTVSRTLAHSFASQDRLGASFFFKRGEAGRGNTSQFISTVAADLARRQPTVAYYIQSAIDSDPTISRKTMREQFDKLIWDPISVNPLGVQKTEPIIIIIDALDECDQACDIQDIIRLFSRTTTQQSIQLKIFLTSRPEMSVRLGFREIGGNFRSIALHEIPTPIVDRDILVEKDRQLATNWPGQVKVETLMRMATPLFIFAAMVCRFVNDRRLGTPDGQLNEVLQFELGGHGSHMQLDATYLPVLATMIAEVPSMERNSIIREFQNIVGSIIILQHPLSTSALSQLLNIRKSVIDARLDLLHSVLHIPSSAASPVRMLHSSFRDFLLDPEKRQSNPFWIDEELAHTMMVANFAFSPDSALVASGSDDATVRLWRMATSKCVNVLKGHRRSITSVAFSPDSALLVSGSNDETIRVWHVATGDCMQTLEGHSDYINSVAFSGDSTLVASGSDDETIRIWQVATGDCMQKLQGHSSYITSVAFSGDSTLVASGSDDETIRIWQVATGVIVQTLEGHSGYITSVAFSGDSTLVASGSDNGTTRIWRVATGECVQTLDIGFSSSRLSFDDSSSWLLTDHGAISIEEGTVESSPADAVANSTAAGHAIFGIRNDESWITWAGKHLVWLPEGYRPWASAVSGSNMLAARRGDLKTMANIIDSDPSAVNDPPRGYYGQTALQAACMHGHEDAVRMLVAAGADVHFCGGNNIQRDALQIACGQGNESVVDILLDAGAEVNRSPTSSRPVVGDGARARHSARPSTVVMRYNGRTALQAAAERGHMPLVRRLLALGADVNAPPSPSAGFTALQAAAGNGFVPIVKLLLQHGAEVNGPSANFKGFTALQGACLGGHADLVDILVDAGADVHALGGVYGDGMALHAAAEKGRVDIVRRLVQAGADVNACSFRRGRGQTPLQSAAAGGYDEVIRVLQELGAGGKMGGGRFLFS